MSEEDRSGGNGGVRGLPVGRGNEGGIVGHFRCGDSGGSLVGGGGGVACGGGGVGGAGGGRSRGGEGGRGSLPSLLSTA